MKSLKTISGFAFRECKKLKTIRLGKMLRIVGRCAFADTPAESILIPRYMEKIGGVKYYGKYSTVKTVKIK